MLRDRGEREVSGRGREGRNSDGVERQSCACERSGGGRSELPNPSHSRFHWSDLLGLAEQLG